MRKLPREYTVSCRDIITDEVLSYKDKAREIHLLDYNLAARETDGYMPDLMDEEEIYEILKERFGPEEEEV